MVRFVCDIASFSAWRVSYAPRSTAGDRRIPDRDGILVVRRDLRRLLLLDSVVRIVDSRLIPDAEDLPFGGAVGLPHHVVWIPEYPVAPDPSVGEAAFAATDGVRGPVPPVASWISSPRGGGEIGIQGVAADHFAATRAVVEQGDEMQSKLLGGLGYLSGSWAPALVASSIGKRSGADNLQTLALSLSSSPSPASWMLREIPDQAADIIS